jgi:hypothetical protein
MYITRIDITFNAVNLGWHHLIAHSYSRHIVIIFLNHLFTADNVC